MCPFLICIIVTYVIRSLDCLGIITPCYLSRKQLLVLFEPLRES